MARHHWQKTPHSTEIKACRHCGLERKPASLDGKRDFEYWRDGRWQRLPYVPKCTGVIA